MIRRFLFCFAALFFCALAPASAQERIAHFDARIEVQDDSALIVTERITVIAEGRQIKRGIYRDLPTIFRRKGAPTLTATLDVLSVERDGAPEPYHSKSIRNGQRIYIGSEQTYLTHGVYTYTLRYRTQRQLRFFDAYDEVYWNVTGNEWAFPIDFAAADIVLPKGAAPVSQAAYTGPLGSTGSNYAVIDDVRGDRFIRFEATRPLNSGEGLTVAVSFPKGFVTPPPFVSTVDLMFAHPVFRGLLAGLAGLAVFYALVWLMAGRDPNGRAIMPAFSPPDGLSPAACRYIMRLGADDNPTLSAAMMNIAAKGYWRIEQEGTRFKSYTLVRDPSAALSASLTQAEQALAGMASNNPKAMIAQQIKISLEKMPFLGPLRGLIEAGLARDKDAAEKGIVRLKLSSGNQTVIRAAIIAFRESLKKEYAQVYFHRNDGGAIFGGLLALVIAGVAGVFSLLRPEIEDGPAVTALMLTMGGGFIMLWLTRAVTQRLDPAYISPRKFAVSNYVSLVIGLIMFSTFMSQGGGRLYEGLADSPFFTSPDFWYPFGVALSAAALHGIFGHLIKTPTRRGRDVMDRIMGFRMFLAAAEKDRLNFAHPPQKTPELFEKFLPYAVALGVENEWADQFTDVFAQFQRDHGHAYAPSWYAGGLSTRGFSTGDIASFSSGISDAASSAAYPGGSSGSGGGGSSGGGGGGGGGGGW